MEELQARHRKEQRDLQSRITQKKKQASKKTRKGVNEECENLEAELKERQRAEVVAFSGDNKQDDDVERQLDDMTLNANEDSSPTATGEEARANGVEPVSENGQVTTPPKKQNRQKARLA